MASEEHLGELIDESAAGREVAIARDDAPAVRLMLGSQEGQEPYEPSEAQRQAWLEENREAITAYNEHVAQHGVFSAGLRCF